MGGHFVPSPRDLADQVRMPIGDPAQHEEGGFDAARGEQVEQAQNIRLHAGFQLLPILARDDAAHVLDREPILHVHAHHVAGLAVHRILSVSKNENSCSGSVASQRSSTPLLSQYQAGMASGT